MKRILFAVAILIMATVATAENYAHSVGFAFGNWPSSTSWGSSYSAKSAVFDGVVKVSFTSTSKQSQTIQDIPVGKGGTITVCHNDETTEIVAVRLKCRQWTNKAQTITLKTSTDGTTFTSSGITSSTFDIESTALGEGVKAVQFAFNSSSNQVGFDSLYITFAGETGVTPPVTVAVPTFSVEEGSFSAPFDLTLSAEAGASIYYTLDGTIPTTSSTLYSAPIHIEQTTTVKAIAAVDTNLSAVATATYTYEEPVVRYNYDQSIGFAFASMSAEELAKWGSSYGEHTMLFGDTEVFFKEANKQGSTITDIPVARGKEIVVRNLNGNTIKAIRLKCRQWNTKAQTITLNTSTDGEDYTATSITSTTFDIEDTIVATGVKYVKFTFSTSGNQIGIDSLYITYNNDGSLAMPLFSKIGGSVIDEFDLELTSSVEGASIYYTLDGTEPTSASTLYTAPIRLSATTTVKAIAVLGTLVSNVAEATYTFPVVVSDIAGFIAAASSDNVRISGDVTVTYSAKNGSRLNTFITDASGSILIYGDVDGALEAAALTNGTTISGLVGTYTVYNTIHELEPVAFNSQFGTGTAVAPTQLTIDQVTAAHQSEYVAVKSVNITAVTFAEGTATNATVTKGESTLSVRSAFKNIVATFAEGDSVNVEGFVSVNSGAPQLLITAIAACPRIIVAPVISQVSGTYADSIDVTITAADADAQIAYTLDGTEPTAESAIYSAPIRIKNSCTLKAVAFVGEIFSTVVSAEYVITETPHIDVAAPTFTPAAGTYADSVDVTLACATDDAVIVYTLDGTEPTSESTVYSSPIRLRANTTIKAYAYVGIDASAVVSAEYVITETQHIDVAAPTFTPAAGTYADSVDVTLACSTDDAIIVYTLDGTEPTSESTVYSAPIRLRANTTIKAYAYVGIDASAVVSAEYVITETPQKPDTTNWDAIISYAFDVDTTLYADWTSSYALHTVTMQGVVATFEKADKQQSGNAIDDVPVTKGNYVEFKAENSDLTIAAIRLVCRQWGSKGQTITMNTSADGANFTAAAATSSNFVYEDLALPAGTKNVRFTFSSQINQVGIDSVYVLFGAFDGVMAPAFSVKGGNVMEAFNLEITAEEGAEIYYTLDGTEPTAESTLYAAPISIEQTTTVKAVAIKAGEVSSVATATYTFPIEVATIAEFIALADEVNNVKITAPVTVTYSAMNGRNLNTFITDGTTSTLIYGDVEGALQAMNLQNGDVLRGVVGTYTEYQSLIELKPAAVPTKEEGTAIEPADLTIDQITASKQSELIRIVGIMDAEYNVVEGDKASNVNIHDETGSVAVRNSFSNITCELNEGAEVEVIGLISVYGEDLQVAMISIRLLHDVAVDEATVNAKVYSNGATVYVETEAGAEVNVYSIDGRAIARTTTTSNVTTLSGINAEIVVVTVNGQAYKLIMK